MQNKWLAGVLGFFVPPLAFVYLSKIRLALIYFAALIAVAFLDLYIRGLVEYTVAGLILAFVAAIHAFNVARSDHNLILSRWYNNWWGILSIPLVLFSLIFFVRSFVIEPFSIPSQSMSPTIETGDYVLVKKWGYGLYGSFGITLISQDIERRTSLKRGEIAVLIPPHIATPFIERVIGLPGDVVEFENKILTINGNPVKTEFLENGFVKESIGEISYTIKYVNESNPLRSGRWVVPAGHYFVMGDNRDNSADSRAWGMVPAENMMGLFILKW